MFVEMKNLYRSLARPYRLRRSPLKNRVKGILLLLPFLLLLLLPEEQFMNRSLKEIGLRGGKERGRQKDLEHPRLLLLLLLQQPLVAAFL